MNNGSKKTLLICNHSPLFLLELKPYPRHSVSGNDNYVINKKIDVGRWYHLEIKQEKKNQNVRKNF